MRTMSKNLVQAAAGLTLLAAGCAKFPDSGNTLITKRLVFTMRVAGAIRYGQGVGQQPYIYIVPLRLSKIANPTDLGPIPVTTFGGNGFVAGHATHYVVYNPAATNPFEIWEFSDGGLINRFQKGVAINYLDPRNSGRPDTLKFEIDMSQLVPAAEVNDILNVQANFLTMDRLAIDQNGHSWDALGDGKIVSQDNLFLSFELRNSRTISNTTTQLEPPTGDVRGTNDPDLDLREWSVEIQLQN